MPFSVPIRFLFILLLFLSQTIITRSSLQGQNLETAIPVELGAPFLEPDGKKMSAKVKDGFVALIKVNGSLTGESNYSLEKYDSTLKKLFQVPLKIPYYEDYKGILFNGSDILLFSVSYSKAPGESLFIVCGFDPMNGAKKFQKILSTVPVKDWTNEKFKGGVHETFENTISSYLNKNFITPLIYQYDFKFSADSSKILAYIFDYSERNLAIQTFTFDKLLNKISERRIPVDNNFINYGVHINNRGDLYILNADRSGKASLIQIRVDGQHALLSIENGSGSRERFKLNFLDDDVVYLGNLITKNEVLTGLMYSKLNFVTMNIDKVRIFDVSDSLKNEINFTAQPIRGSVVEENWKNFDLTNFVVDKNEEVLLVLEKRELLSTAIAYSASLVNDFEKWGEKKAFVHTGGMMMVSFNSNDELSWKHFYNKSQKADVSGGLISTSFVLDNSQENQIRLVYASSDNASGIFNLIKFVAWDKSTGEVLKEQTLENPENLGLIRDYTLWWDDKIVLVGRKGLMGKKSYLHLYRL